MVSTISLDDDGVVRSRNPAACGRTGSCRCDLENSGWLSNLPSNVAYRLRYLPSPQKRRFRARRRFLRNVSKQNRDCLLTIAGDLNLRKLHCETETSGGLPNFVPRSIVGQRLNINYIRTSSMRRFRFRGGFLTVTLKMFLSVSWLGS